MNSVVIKRCSRNYDQNVEKRGYHHKVKCLKGTGHHVVGDEKTSVTMVFNKSLWLEINANTSSNERMHARHRFL